MITKKQYKQWMEEFGWPDSSSLLCTLQKCAKESARIERNNIFKKIINKINIFQYMSIRTGVGMRSMPEHVKKALIQEIEKIKDE